MQSHSARIFALFLLPALLVTGGVSAAPQQADAPHAIVFPTVSTYALDKTRATLPQDFAGQLNLLLLSFEREQQPDVNSWMPAARQLQKTNAALQVYVLPIFTKENMLFRWWEEMSLRNDTSPEAMRHTLPLYVNKPQFRRDLQIASEKQVVVLLADRSGKVLWRAEGALNDEKRAAFAAAAGTPQPQH